MKIIILSGGRGYRLKEKTEWIPKPMITIGGKPILWHIMKIYAHYGFYDFIVALGYKGDHIRKFFRNDDGFKIAFVDTGLETLPGERVLRVKDHIDGDEFMLTYGDGVSNVNITELVAFHKRQKTIGTITGVHPRTSYGLVKIKEGRNKVIKFVEKPILSEWVSGGFMIFSKDALPFFRKGEMEHPALIRLTESRQLSLYRHEGFWYAMDTYRDMEELNKLWKQHAPWKVWNE